MRLGDESDMKRTGGLHLICSQATTCQLQALVSLRLYIKPRASKGLWRTGAAWHPVFMEKVIQAPLYRFSGEESDCQPLEGHVLLTEMDA